MSHLLICLITHAATVAGAAAADVAPPPDHPNVVLILADDLGWSDLGCYGGDLVETPRLDRFAESAVRFTDACAMSVCSPSRAGLLTGRHPARLQITIWSEGSRGGPQNRRLLQGHSLHDLPHDETTLAEWLKEAGYLTALVGKWHLGDAGHFPETQGFDVNIGGNHWGAPQTFWWPYRGDQRYGGERRYVPHMEFGTAGEYLTDRLTDEAIRVIERAGDQPFFLYLSHYAPHTPIEAPQDTVQHFAEQVTADLHHQNPVYAAMIGNLDTNTGRVLDSLDEHGLTDNTIVIFASDNGGFVGTDRGQSVPVTNNHPLRSGKGSLYEGGIRVPLLIRWPGVTTGGTVCETPVVLMDIPPTLVNRVTDQGGQPHERRRPFDGIDLRPALRDPNAPLPRDALFFHYPHYYPTTTPVSAVRAGRWKLLEYFEDGHTELYDLESDPSESRDLSAVHPDRIARLHARLKAWRQDVGASLPQPNPRLPRPAR